MSRSLEGCQYAIQRSQMNMYTYTKSFAIQSQVVVATCCDWLSGLQSAGGAMAKPTSVRADACAAWNPLRGFDEVPSPTDDLLDSELDQNLRKFSRALVSPGRDPGLRCGGAASLCGNRQAPGFDSDCSWALGRDCAGLLLHPGRQGYAGAPECFPDGRGRGDPPQGCAPGESTASYAEVSAVVSRGTGLSGRHGLSLSADCR